MALSIRTKRALAATLGVIPVVALAYASCIEPRWLDVTGHTVRVRGLKSTLTIAQVSDLHMKSLGMIEQSTLDAIARAKPDVVVVTGDLYDKERGRAAATRFLASIDAPLGVWYAPGNWEHWVRGKEPYLDDAVLASTGATQVHALTNASAPLRDDVSLIGLDDAFAGAPDVSRAFAGVPANVARIAFFHSPSLFDRPGLPEVDLALAGHTHGGQVRLPFVGAVWLPPSSGRFVDGWYRSSTDTPLFVSRGIGTSVAPLRFLCRPELAIIRAEPSSP